MGTGCNHRTSYSYKPVIFGGGSCVPIPGALAEVSPIDFHRGERIGKYEVVTQLSVGGMAELFLGYTSGPGGFRKYVVVKRILPDARENEQFMRMFLDEARITAAFNHPNIGQVFDLGQEDEGLYLAMEFIAGQNLNQITSACLRSKRQVPIGFTLSVARDVCLALHYAHTFKAPSGEPSPVIHRDVAQKNVMVTYDGLVKLLDFGIAKAKGSLERTHVGTVKGTTGYMSPEQVRGEQLDGRSDLFSVGVMMHELITGARLFAGRDERDEMVRILDAPIPWPSHVTKHVPEPVSKVVMQALERSREKRFANGRDMARAIEEAAGRTLMDADHRATLMQELFSERMAATRALLESVEGRLHTSMVESAKRALRGDDGPYLPARKATDLAKALGVGEAKSPSQKVAAAKVAEKAEAVARDTAGTKALWALVMVTLVVAGGYGVLRLTHTLDSDTESKQPRLSRFGPDGRTLPEFPEDGGRPRTALLSVGPGGETTDERDEEPEDAGVRPLTTMTPDDAKPQVRDSKAPKGQGKLLLGIATKTKAQVYLGKTKLGETPVIDAPLPAGRHTLRIVTILTGEERRFPVTIKANEKTSFKFGSLEELGHPVK